MREEMKTALLQMYDNLSAASERQAERGGHDQGARSQVTGGKHLNCVAEVIRNDLIAVGYNAQEVYYKDGCLRLPGWYRPSKDWDLLAFDDNDLLAILELKSINSSFGNNANNRSEESLGSAVGAAHAIKNELIPFQTAPPLLAYVLVIKLCDDSTRVSSTAQKSVYPIDEVFKHTSYFERLTIFCRRLLAERLYQAVWVVGVNPNTGGIIEPDRDLTYEKFIAALKAQLDVHRA